MKDSEALIAQINQIKYSLLEMEDMLSLLKAKDIRIEEKYIYFKECRYWMGCMEYSCNKMEEILLPKHDD